MATFHAAVSAKEGQRQAALATSRVNLEKLDLKKLWEKIQQEADDLSKSEPLIASTVRL